MRVSRYTRRTVRAHFSAIAKKYLQQEQYKQILYNFLAIIKSDNNPYTNQLKKLFLLFFFFFEKEKFR